MTTIKESRLKVKHQGVIVEVFPETTLSKIKVSKAGGDLSNSGISLLKMNASGMGYVHLTDGIDLTTNPSAFGAVPLEHPNIHTTHDVYYSEGRTINQWLNSTVDGMVPIDSNEIIPDEYIPEYIQKHNRFGGVTENNTNTKSIHSDVFKYTTFPTNQNDTGMYYLVSKESDFTVEPGISKFVHTNETVEHLTEGDRIILVSLENGEYSFAVIKHDFGKATYSKKGVVRLSSKGAPAVTLKRSDLSDSGVDSRIVTEKLLRSVLKDIHFLESGNTEYLSTMNPVYNEIAINAASTPAIIIYEIAGASAVNHPTHTTGTSDVDFPIGSVDSYVINAQGNLYKVTAAGTTSTTLQFIMNGSPFPNITNLGITRLTGIDGIWRLEDTISGGVSASEYKYHIFTNKTDDFLEGDLIFD